MAILSVEPSVRGPLLKSIDECRLEWFRSRIDAADGRDGLSSPEANVVRGEWLSVPGGGGGGCDGDLGFSRDGLRG